MTVTEIAAIIGGLLLGYYLVSLVTGRKDVKPAPPRFDRTGAVPASPSAALPAWHQVLEIAPDASPSEVRTAYRRLMSQYHPDKVASLGSELQALAERKSREIGAAYREGMREHGLEV